MVSNLFIPHGGKSSMICLNCSKNSGNWTGRSRWKTQRILATISNSMDFSSPFQTVQTGGADLTLLAYVRRLQAGLRHKAGHGQTQQTCLDRVYILF